MSEHPIVTSGVASVFLPVAATLLVSITAAAAPSARAGDGRAGRFELFAVASYEGEAEADLPRRFPSDIPRELTWEEGFAGGLGLGYNVNDHLNLNLTLVTGDADRTIDQETDSGIVQRPFRDGMDATRVEINADLYLLDGPLTPFATAGIGLNILSGSGRNDVSDVDDLEDENTLAYGAGLGVRWDLGDHLFLKLWYRSTWFAPENADDEFQLHSANLAVGFMW